MHFQPADAHVSGSSQNVIRHRLEQSSRTFTQKVEDRSESAPYIARIIY